MSDIYLPIIRNGSGPSPDPTPTPTPTPTPIPTPGSSTRIAIDPITRIEGHLRIEVQVENGIVKDAWSAGTMFRGIEPILIGRDPREAWAFTQRICGVCTTVHALASVRAVENALGITVPDNARIVRNLIEGAQFVQDHVIHFYHLHALDWVDIVSALSADPASTSDLARSISDWPNSTPEYFAAVKDRLNTFVSSGQLGLFANGYWGHPAYKLPPEGNLLAVAHYLEALDWQREYIKIHAYLGGKNPHLQTYLVGGTAITLDPTSSVAINPEKITLLRDLIAKGLDFVSRVYIPDLLLVASFYKDWGTLGGGNGNFLSYGDFPTDTSGSLNALSFPQGVIWNKNISLAPEPINPDQIQEYISRSWYSYQEGDKAAKHPYQGETVANYTGPIPPYDFLDIEQKYSWLKAPRYVGQPMEVGPLARTLIAYSSGHARIRELTYLVLRTLNLTPEALFSTLGRVAARGIETQVVAEQMNGWLDQLEHNLHENNLTIHDGALWDPANWPAEAVGWGTTEAPRGALGHWIRIKDRKIANYQAIVPTTWNGSPRDANGVRGVWEEALIGTPVAKLEKPLEILRVIHSFDPCMACAVHVMDTSGRKSLVSVNVHRS